MTDWWNKFNEDDEAPGQTLESPKRKPSTDNFDPEVYLRDIQRLHKQFGTQKMPVPSAPKLNDSDPHFDHILAQTPPEKVNVTTSSGEKEEVSWTDDEDSSGIKEIYNPSEATQQQALSDLRNKLGISLPDDSLREIHRQISQDATTHADAMAEQYDREQSAYDDGNESFVVDEVPEKDDVHTDETPVKQAAPAAAQQPTDWGLDLDAAASKRAEQPEPQTPPPAVETPPQSPAPVQEPEPEVTDEIVAASIEQTEEKLKSLVPKDDEKEDEDDSPSVTPGDALAALKEEAEEPQVPEVKTPDEDIEDHIASIDAELERLKTGERTESEKIAHLKEGVQRCRELLRNGETDGLKSYYNSLNKLFHSLDKEDPDRRKWFGVLKKLYDDINQT